MRNRLEKRLKIIEKLLLQMSRAAEKALIWSVEALEQDDEGSSIKVIEWDQRIDQLEADIEKRCIQLIGLEQPLARDLRRVSGTLRLIADLERIGDYAVDLARIQLSKRSLSTLHREEMREMAALVCQMMERALNALFLDNAEEARQTAQRDQLIDQRYEEWYHLLIEELRRGNSPENIVDLLFCNRYLERIGDHITNLCEEIIYILEGVREYY